MSTPRTVLRNSLLLASFAALAAGLIAGTWRSTALDIQRAEQAAEARQLLELREPRAGYRVIQPDGEAQSVTGVILPATARDGYSGDIRLLVGVQADGRIAGVRTVGHRETPGLGDKIERKKSDWILDFNGRALGDPAFKQWTVRKDGGVFDQFTGATVTPRAVVTAVRRTLEYVQSHRDTLFALPANGTPVASAEAAQEEPAS